MVFNTALTGIAAASSELNVVGNNIANANTMGFKASRSQFIDIYTATSGGNPVKGSGVKLSEVKQLHSQGNIAFTNSDLDLAISGEGYFMLSGTDGMTYSRAGSFSVDREGYVVNASGQRLQGLNADTTGKLNKVTTDILINTSSADPSATSEIALGVNVDAHATAPSLAADVYVGGATVDNDTYNNVSSSTIYDSFGKAHVLTTYYIKANAETGAPAEVAGNTNQWFLGFQIDGKDVYDVNSVNGGAATTNASRLPQLNFNSDGSFASVSAPADLAVGSVTPATNGISASGNKLTFTYEPGNGADTMSFTLDFEGGQAPSTQYSSDFSVLTTEQDGFPTGRLENLEVTETGLISGRFSNGQLRTMGQVQLATFANKEGLRANGDTAWVATYDSGELNISSPLTGHLGGINAGALEQSNVDLTAELVALISAQRNFQANAQTIRTADTITQTIINLR